MNDLMHADSLKLRVLVADDDEHARRILRFRLGRLAGALAPDGRQLEVSITEVCDGATAFEHLVQGTFDLLLCDFYMPVMNGVELLGRVRHDAKYSSLPVIFVTGVPEDMFDSMPLADTAFLLPKPLRAHELVRVVREACGLSQTAPSRRGVVATAGLVSAPPSPAKSEHAQ